MSNIRDYATATVPEHTFALILALRRSLIGYRSDVIDGAWARSGQFCFFNHPIADLAGSTLGVIGAGHLGQAVATLGRAFGMKVLFAAHKGVDGMGALYTPFDEVLARSDVITLHCPLTPATRGLIAEPEFRAMERSPIVVNIARGGLVDELAIFAALKAGRIAGFGFDVTDPEPMPDSHPFTEILSMPNVIVTPHIVWAGARSMQLLCDELTRNIEAALTGEPRNLL